ncbi:hypothetical protein X777_03123 [Ooceraea biroi]|uniref:Uncharacterized protein n=1 Tax=Ooceraea biroi TaxID=2015173 RepID=A0A026WKC4_OOCBI|nr:hypothetical protein X777_03123 [Ooceraea biroi]
MINVISVRKIYLRYEGGLELRFHEFHRQTASVLVFAEDENRARTTSYTSVGKSKSVQ